MDGSRLQLPNHPSVKEDFGEVEAERNGDTVRSTATRSVTLFYNVLSQVTIDAQLGSYKHTTKKKFGERTLFNQRLNELQSGDSLFPDLGYLDLFIIVL